MAVVAANSKFGSHDWDSMSVKDWSAHTDVPGMYIDERKNLYEDILPAVMKDVEIVIDVGCGLAEDTFYIANAYPNAQVVGIDFNKDFLKHGETILASDHPTLQSRVSFQWADLRSMSEADKLSQLVNGRKALYYMGGNTIGIVPEGLEATIGAAMNIKDKFLVVAHYTPFLKTMYHDYYAKVVGEADLAVTDFDNGIYVSKGDYRSQWFTPETLSARITKFANLSEDECVCGEAAGVFGIYSKHVRTAFVDARSKFGSHDWDTMSVKDWSAHTDVPGMYIDERRNLYEDILPTAMQDVEIVLDIGCGLGEDTFFIAEAYPNAEVVGVDFNKDFLQHGEKVLASDHPKLQHRVSFQWADLRLMSEADKLRKVANGRKALYYMGGNTIGIVPEGLEATIGAAMDIKDAFLVVAHYTPFLKTMYRDYYAKVVGEADLSVTDFDMGLYVSKGDYRSQWYTPETLSARITKFANLAEASCVCGASAGVFGIYSKMGRISAVDAKSKFGSHDWDTMSVKDWSAHTDVPGMYIDERKNLNEDILPAAMKDVEIVFDIGCGLGEDTLYIAETYPNAQVVGVDFNKDFLKHCEKVLASDHAKLQSRVSFQWADLRLLSEAAKFRQLVNGRKALYYMGGNTIGIVPEGLEATIGAAMSTKDKFLVVAHYTPFLKTMYRDYYAKVVGEADLSVTDFDNGLYVSKGDYRSQWYTPETLSARITKFANLTEDSCVCGASAGVFGTYSKQLRSSM